MKNIKNLIKNSKEEQILKSLEKLDKNDIFQNIDDLIYLFSNKEFKFCDEFSKILLKHKTDCFKALVKLINNENPIIRFWIYKNIFQTSKTKKIDKYLIKALNDSSLDIQKLAIYFIDDYNKLDILKTFFSLLNSSNEKLRNEIFYILKKHSKDLKDDIIKNLRSDDKKIQYFSLILLTELKDSKDVNLILELEKDIDDERLEWILYSLKEYKTLKVTKKLIEYLNYEYWGIRKIAAEGLMLHYESRRKYLKENLIKFSQNEKYWILRIISEKRDIELFELFIKNIENETWSIKSLIAFIIGENKYSDYIQILKKLLFDENYDVRKNAYIAYYNIDKIGFDKINLKNNEKEAEEVIGQLLT